MTIDEILCKIARDNALIFTEEEQDAMAEAILSVRELQWYRSQDLIKREDAVSIVRSVPYRVEGILIVTLVAKAKIVCGIEQIRKRKWQRSYCYLYYCSCYSAQTKRGEP